MTASNRAKFIPIDQRDHSTVRAGVCAQSDPGAKAKVMSSQVERSKAFIEAHGWRLVADTYAFTEAATGMRNVARPVLQDVLKLAVRGDIDVIVAAEMERIARSEGRRWRAIQTAEDHGVEFRFANLPRDDPMHVERCGRMRRPRHPQARGACPVGCALVAGDERAERTG